jgi:hypothetical protein
MLVELTFSALLSFVFASGSVSGDGANTTGTQQSSVNGYAASGPVRGGGDTTGKPSASLGPHTYD